MQYLKLLRPKQWSKNLLVFAAFIFAGKFSEPALFQTVLLAFIALCCVSSATYIANDILDIERDRAHPKKQHRPIASGKVPVPAAVCMTLFLLSAGILIAQSFNNSSLYLILGYLGLQVLYNGFLKKTPIADVFCISIGFVIRATFGATAIWVPISGWLLFCTGALALMLGFAKRRHEFLLQGEDRHLSRESLSGYNRATLDALVIMTATGASLCYGIYSVDSTTASKYPAIVLTSIFVFYGVARYVMLIFSQDEGGEPADILFKDPHILGSVLLFLASAILAVSGLEIPLLVK